MKWPGLAHLLLDDLVLLGLLGQALGGGLQVPQVDQPVQRAPGGRRGAVGRCSGEVQGGGAGRRWGAEPAVADYCLGVRGQIATCRVVHSAQCTAQCTVDSAQCTV